MRSPQIKMESKQAQITIQQLPAKQTIKQKEAALSIEQPKAMLSIETKPSRLSIDQSQAWEEMNIMPTSRWIKKQAQEGVKIAGEGTGRRAEQGTQLMQIEHGGNPIKEQARINGHSQQKRVGLKYIPSPFAVQFHYVPADVHINVKLNEPIIQVNTNRPEVSYERGKVEIAMKQYAQLHIDFDYLFSKTI